MTDIITDKSRKPEFDEISAFIGNPLFDEMCGRLTKDFAAQYDICYSGDKVLLGWNVSFRKSGRSLCRLYPKEGFFSVLIVVGKKEKERVEALLPEMSEEMRRIYDSTVEGNGQRWLVYDLCDCGGLYEDTLRLVKIRRESK